MNCLTLNIKCKTNWIVLHLNCLTPELSYTFWMNCLTLLLKKNLGIDCGCGRVMVFFERKEVMSNGKTHKGVKTTPWESRKTRLSGRDQAWQKVCCASLRSTRGWIASACRGTSSSQTPLPLADSHWARSLPLTTGGGCTTHSNLLHGGGGIVLHSHSKYFIDMTTTINLTCLRYEENYHHEIFN